MTNTGFFEKGKYIEPDCLMKKQSKYLRPEIFQEEFLISKQNQVILSRKFFFFENRKYRFDK